MSEITEFICLLFAVYFLWSRRVTYWKACTWFMLFTLVVETSGKIIASVFHRPNLWLYNIYLPVQVIFTGWMLYRVFPAPAVKRPWFITGILVFTVVYLLETFGYTHFKGYNTVSDTVSSFFIVIACSFYYLDMLKKDNHEKLSKSAAFWFVSGTLLFNYGNLACNIFSDEIMTILVTKKLSLRYIIVYLLTLVLCTFWAYSFKCRYQETI